jgi:Site-specific recombinase XerD
MPIKLIAPRKGKTPYYAGRGTYLGVYVDRSTKTGKRAVAVKVIAQWEREIEGGCFAVKGEPTFASAAAAYMKAGGQRTYLKKLLEHFGDKPLRQIDQTAIDHAAAAVYSGAGPATRNRQCYTPISAVLRHAGHTLQLRRPKGSGGAKQTAWLWPEETERLFIEAEKINKDFAALLITLCYTGMRLSEALNLTWEKVRLADGFAYVPDTKNNEPRPVFLPPVAVASLGNVNDDRTGRVFPFNKGGHIYSLLRVSAIKADVELPERSAFHILRHTYATWMRRYAGADSQSLIATGAWKDRKSVERYSHTIVSEESKRALLLPVPKARKG